MESMPALFPPIRYKGTFTSVGEILRREGMVQVSSVCVCRDLFFLNCICVHMQYEPCSPLTLDLPVTCELESVLTGMQQVMPVKTYVKSEVYKQEAHRVEPVMPVSSKDDIGSMTTGDSGIPEQTPAGDDSIAIDEGSCITEQTSMTQVASVVSFTPINAHQDIRIPSNPATLGTSQSVLITRIKHTQGLFRVARIQGWPHFRGPGLGGVHCIYVSLQALGSQDTSSRGLSFGL